jgi:hypothetical protein
MSKIHSLLLLCLGLVACDSHLQTTSGAEYLEKNKNVPSGPAANSKNTSIEDKIRKVAAVEPTLRFPARIGLARIDNGRLSALPGEEVAAWDKVKHKLGSGFGELVPLNPMIAEMVSQSVLSNNDNMTNNVMDKIRLGAGRQHLDAVLIYEVYSNTGSENNLLSIADLTIIGGFILPSRAISAEGYASAMLIDVLQGYPYGTVDVTVDKEEQYSTSWGSNNKERELSNSAKTKAAIKLTEEAEKMFQRLRLELAEKRAKK